jgi:hypothetical protein
LRASINYYIAALGFKRNWETPNFVEVARDRCGIMLSEGDQGRSGSVADHSTTPRRRVSGPISGGVGRQPNYAAAQNVASLARRLIGSSRQRSNGIWELHLP